MAYSSLPAISLAYQTASTTWFPLTDHNRQPFDISYEIIEKSSRMADGTMRKYVVNKKKKLSVSWNDVPSGTGVPYNQVGSSSAVQNLTLTVDGYKGGAWIKSFYEANLFKPVYVRIVHSQDNALLNSSSAFYPSSSSAGAEYMWAFMSNFDYNVTKRYGYTDLVSIKIEFTEI
jgi:hypothetical protein